ncbi:major facilitator superfamily MFS_1 [Gloeothece citriformis PCC 7424]|uniref:Major facilitator superfamily MFS_1 n=1 Tax=Gloeothece citriformis (strain PCC 7424) TaxID=65393 RepID=B7KEZ8_GLOC7|nr:MFS transporter [Gloeothece citriformis]ACK70454.1 major facilitator superfamily MFS_1 [Gloeothece citriformis PCC 7424]
MTKSLQNLLRALESRNYRLFFGGQCISLIGTWMTQIAAVWLVYSLTNSALLLGLVGFCSQIPNFIITPFSGILVDRWNRRNILIVTQILSMIQSLTLAGLTLTGLITIEQLIGLSLFQGVISAFDAPARQVFVTDIVENKAHLGNAIALNSSMFNGARLVGPAIAGVVIASLGVGACFLIDGLSYIAVIAGLLAIKIPPKTLEILHTNGWQRLKEGFEYTFSFPPFRAILGLLALFSFAGMSYMVLIPIFAEKILKGDAQTLGFLTSASGIGALMGGIYLSSRQSIVGLGKLIVSSLGLFGISLMIFSQSQMLWLSLLMMFITGLCGIINIASSNTILQTISEENKRGRLMSFYTMSFLGILPFGNLAVGALANQISAPTTLLLCGILCILTSFFFRQQLPKLRQYMRPIYDKLGLLNA